MNAFVYLIFTFISITEHEAIQGRLCQTITPRTLYTFTGSTKEQLQTILKLDRRLMKQPLWKISDCCFSRGKNVTLAHFWCLCLAKSCVTSGFVYFLTKMKHFEFSRHGQHNSLWERIILKKERWTNKNTLAFNNVSCSTFIWSLMLHLFYIHKYKILWQKKECSFIG